MSVCVFVCVCVCGVVRSIIGGGLNSKRGKKGWIECGKVEGDEGRLFREWEREEAKSVLKEKGRRW